MSRLKNIPDEREIAVKNASLILKEMKLAGYDVWTHGRAWTATIALIEHDGRIARLRYYEGGPRAWAEDARSGWYAMWGQRELPCESVEEALAHIRDYLEGRIKARGF